MKHINIPVFIPHLGCPNECVFCNQRSISGKTVFEESSVDSEINTALSTIGNDKNVEIAYFGGSFTGIDRDLMIRLLEKANGYIDAGKAYGIRLSTRPDYINEEILDILEKYRVKDIELGIQSMSDEVLAASKRGHDSKCSYDACRLIKKRGFNLIGQMMLGLPCSDAEKECETARKLCELGVDGARIYPTVVFSGTELDAMRVKGIYSPLTFEDTVKRCTDVLEIFDKYNVKVIRIGLCSQDNLFDEKTVTAGDYSSAIGEITQSELFFRKIRSALSSLSNIPEKLTVYCPTGCTSKVVGHKKRNSDRIKKLYGIKDIKVIEKNSLLGYNIMIN